MKQLLIQGNTAASKLPNVNLAAAAISLAIGALHKRTGGKYDANLRDSIVERLGTILREGDEELLPEALATLLVLEDVNVDSKDDVQNVVDGIPEISKSRTQTTRTNLYRGCADHEKNAR